MSFDGRNKPMVDRRGMRHATDTAGERCRSSMCHCCVGTFSLSGLLVLRLVRHVYEAAYVCRLYALLWRYREELTKEEGFKRL